MKSYLLLSLAFFLSCSTVKKTDAQEETQLLKDVKILSSDEYQGRKTGTKGAEMSRSYLSERFKKIGIKPFTAFPDYEQSFSFKRGSAANTPEIAGKNMIGYIQGKTDDVIVISAHYDHVGVIKEEVYNGADDNASGVAGLLHIAAYFAKHKPNHTLVFASFDAEEMGLQGAKAFVAKPPVAIDKIQMNVNMDMISHNDKSELYACGTFKYPELKKYFILKSNDIKVLFGHDDPKQGHDDWTNQSDQGAFNAKNIPFLYFGVEDHKDYHKATDEYQNINKTFFNNAATAILEITNNIDKEIDIQKIFKENLQMKKQ
ncbi:M20/M25/M40 family metallo-hydrolase [Pedobacter metabolipauper]|uniref:Peptidase M28-like protein n=1 Tax=Pedobacter metabolipauper TaxID=425513 RepID=A0A4R6SUQ3_9SPHI|nr:M20/M25/M40 family metallo-hydrolase [Pedobacter metabolipauper]TDQ08159.1 peptidase M28-like protein [Pedobacter metabolipauper]